jgi:hypothetical protein
VASDMLDPEALIVTGGVLALFGSDLFSPEHFLKIHTGLLEFEGIVFNIVMFISFLKHHFKK